MSDDEGRASLWVRYLGGTRYHRAETFAVPTDSVPERAKRLWARGDVAEMFYAFDDLDPNKSRGDCARILP